MCTEDDCFPPWNLVQGLHKDGSLILQSGNYMLVVYDFFADIDRFWKDLQGDVHNVNSPNNAGAETSGGCQEDLFCHGEENSSTPIPALAGLLPDLVVNPDG